MGLSAVLNDESLLLTGQQLTLSITGGATLLNAVSVTVNQGELVGLIGPNGAGKSTLLKLLSGVDSPSKGCVSLAISGSLEPISALSVRERA